MEDKKIPYPLAEWLKAQAEGRLVIAKEESPLAHRQFSLTLRPKQILRAFKDCLKADDYSDTKEDELMRVYKAIVDYLLQRNPKLVEPMYRHFKARLEAYYKERRNTVRRQL